MLQGLNTVGVIGTAVGLAVGYSLSWAAGTFRLIPLDPQVYSVPFVPFQANPLVPAYVIAAAPRWRSALPPRLSLHVLPRAFFPLIFCGTE